MQTGTCEAALVQKGLVSIQLSTELACLTLSCDTRNPLGCVLSTEYSHILERKMKLHTEKPDIALLQVSPFSRCVQQTRGPILNTVEDHLRLLLRVAGRSLL